MFSCFYLLYACIPKYFSSETWSPIWMNYTHWGCYYYYTLSKSASLSSCCCGHKSWWLNLVWVSRSSYINIPPPSQVQSFLLWDLSSVSLNVIFWVSITSLAWPWWHLDHYHMHFLSLLNLLKLFSLKPLKLVITWNLHREVQSVRSCFCTRCHLSANYCKLFLHRTKLSNLREANCKISPLIIWTSVVGHQNTTREWRCGATT